jgi:hypothetical protein
MPSLRVRDLPQDVFDALTAAARHGRSLRDGDDQGGPRSMISVIDAGLAVEIALRGEEPA